MLKKLLILSLFFQLAGFTPIFASQEPASNGWGFGTFLAAGAALIGGFKLALWGTQKLRQTVEEKVRAVLQEQHEKEQAEFEQAAKLEVQKQLALAKEMADNVTSEEQQVWQKDHEDYRQENQIANPVMQAPFDKTNDRIEGQKKWVMAKRIEHNKWSRLGFTSQQLQQAANQYIMLDERTANKIDECAVTSYLTDSLVTQLVSSFNMSSHYYRWNGEREKFVPLLPVTVPPLLNRANRVNTAELLETHLLRDVSKICLEYLENSDSIDERPALSAEIQNQLLRRCLTPNYGISEKEDFEHLLQNAYEEADMTMRMWKLNTYYEVLEENKKNHFRWAKEKGRNPADSLYSRGDVIGITDLILQYSGTKINRTLISVNKRKLMLALSALSYRGKYGSGSFKNIYNNRGGWSDEKDFHYSLPGIAQEDWRPPRHLEVLPKWKTEAQNTLGKLVTESRDIRSHDGLE